MSIGVTLTGVVSLVRESNCMVVVKCGRLICSFSEGLVVLCRGCGMVPM